MNIMDGLRLKRSHPDDCGPPLPLSKQIRRDFQQEPSHGISELPMEILEKIVTPIVDLQDIWNLGRVSRTLGFLAWNNVRRLQFSFEEKEEGNIRVYIRQCSCHPQRFGGKLDKIGNCFPVIWKNSINLVELEFGDIIFASNSPVKKDKKDLNDFAGHVQQAQESFPRKIQSLTVNKGIEKTNGFCGVITACSKELVSLELLNTLSNYQISLDYARAVSECSSLRTATIKSDCLFRPLIRLASLGELNCYDDHVAGKSLSAFLPDLHDTTPGGLLRMDEGFFDIYRTLHNDQIQLSRVTSLVIGLGFRGIALSASVTAFFQNLPRLKTVLIGVGESWNRNVMHTDGHRLLNTLNVLISFLSVYGKGKEARSLTAKICGYPEERVTRDLLRVAQKVHKYLGVVGVRVKLWDVEGSGGAEKAGQGHEDGGEVYWKFKLGPARCYLGPLPE